MPAGILSPYSDGERALSSPISPIANGAKGRRGVATRSLLPVTIRGEGAGRRMRGSADITNRTRLPT
ncbi:hypothetical protein FJW04_08335 [Mesorhizobium sp. B2-7-3]|nr:hypothetical protein FJW04_08335 [Mesorhizobium sp. B2-7-3]